MPLDEAAATKSWNKAEESLKDGHQHEASNALQELKDNITKNCTTPEERLAAKNWIDENEKNHSVKLSIDNGKHFKDPTNSEFVIEARVDTFIPVASLFVNFEDKIAKSSDSK